VSQILIIEKAEEAELLPR